MMVVLKPEAQSKTEPQGQNNDSGDTGEDP
jgi:hypothetical protein